MDSQYPGECGCVYNEVSVGGWVYNEVSVCGCVYNEVSVYVCVMACSQ